ncbi:hypothetical protein ACW14Y_05005 [Kitasatospora sp. cg17-2]
MVERTTARLTGYRRVASRYERDHLLHLAFSDLAAAITCHERLTKIPT